MDSMKKIRRDLESGKIRPAQAGKRFRAILGDIDDIDEMTAFHDYLRDKEFESAAPLKSGMELEKAGKIDEAIAEYEKSIAMDFEGDRPYDRLAILYRKRKQIDEEIRVLNKAIGVLKNVVSKNFEHINADLKRLGYPTRGDLNPRLEKFEKRLKQAKELKAKQ